MNHKHQIVIIGGGTGGITVAARLKKAGVADVALIEPVCNVPCSSADRDCHGPLGVLWRTDQHADWSTTPSTFVRPRAADQALAVLQKDPIDASTVVRRFRTSGRWY